MANYPSTITAFTNPSPIDKLSTTPHSSIETAQNTDLTAIETFVGTLSSNVGTLIYDIRATASNGGGHVQTANKGGTGQTAYTKGDILIASSSSVLSKLAISANDNDFLAVNSSVATGVNWTAGVTSGQIQNMAFSNATDTGTGSVYSISPVPCVLGYSHGQIFTFQAKTANAVATPAISVSSLVARTIRNADGTGLNVGQISASAMTMIQYQGNASVFHLLSVTKPTIVKAALFYSTSSVQTLDVSSSYFCAFGQGSDVKTTRPGGMPVPFAGNIKNLYVRSGNDAQNGLPTYTVEVNATATAITKQITAGNQTVSDTVNTTSVLAGDLLTIKVVTGNGGSSGMAQGISLELDAT